MRKLNLFAAVITLAFGAEAFAQAGSIVCRSLSTPDGGPSLNFTHYESRGDGFGVVTDFAASAHTGKLIRVHARRNVGLKVFENSSRIVLRINDSQDVNIVKNADRSLDQVFLFTERDPYTPNGAGINFLQRIGCSRSAQDLLRLQYPPRQRI